jgi:hypothetical protein
VTIVPRSGWCTVPRRSVPSVIPARQNTVWLHHGASGTSTVATANAYTRWHIHNNGWADIGYSWLVAGGKVLEGRGPGRAGAHTQGQNLTSYGVCMVGDYTRLGPSPADLDALVWLLRHGVERGWWGQPRLAGGHTDAPGADTDCPGAGLYPLIGTVNRLAATPPPEDVMTPAQEAKLDRLIAAIGIADDPQLGPVLRHTQSNLSHYLRSVLPGRVARLFPDVDPQTLTDAQVDELAHAIADGLDERVAKRTVELIGQRFR